MSRTIEQKVVEMRFDNSNFEKNVSSSIDSLNKLQESINKTSAGDAFADIGKAASNLNFSGLTASIQTVTESFSWLEQIAIGALRNIGAQIEEKLVAALKHVTFDQIYAGFTRFGELTESTQTILSAIANEDYGSVNKLDYTEELLRKLAWFSDETSYNFTDMTSNIAKFTAAGLDLDQSTTAMMGIATWAANAGQNAQTASRAMYQLSQAMGMGSIRLMDWKSIEVANMATKEVKDLLLQYAALSKDSALMLDETGYYYENVTKSGVERIDIDNKNFRESLKYGWLTADAFSQAMGEYASYSEALYKIIEKNEKNADGSTLIASDLIEMFDEAIEKSKETGESIEDIMLKDYKIDVMVDDGNGSLVSAIAGVTELGIRAMKSAQQARTWQQVVDSITDAASTRWSFIFQHIFGNVEEATELFTFMANKFYDVFVEPFNKLEAIMSLWKEFGGRDILFSVDKNNETQSAIQNLFEALETLLDAIHNGVARVFPIFGEENEDLAKRLVASTEKFRKWTASLVLSDEKAEKLSKTVASVLKVFKTFGQIIGSVFGAVIRVAKQVWGVFQEVFGGLAGQVVKSRLSELFQNIANAIINITKNIKLSDGAISSLKKIFESVSRVFNTLVSLFGKLSDKIKQSGLDGKFQKIGEAIGGKFMEVILWLPEKIADLVAKLVDFISTSEVIPKVGEWFKKGIDFVKGFFDAMIPGEGVVGKIHTIIEAVKGFIAAIKETDAYKKVSDAISGLFTDANNFFSEGNAYDKGAEIFNNLKTAAENLGTTISDFGQKVWDGLQKAVDAVKKFLGIQDDAKEASKESQKDISKKGEGLGIGPVGTGVGIGVEAFSDVTENMYITRDSVEETSEAGFTLNGALKSIGGVLGSVLETISKYLPGIGIGAAGLALGKMFLDIASGFKNIGWGIDKIGTALKKIGKAQQVKAWGSAISKVVASIALLVGAVAAAAYVLSGLDAEGRKSLSRAAIEMSDFISEVVKSVLLLVGVSKIGLKLGPISLGGGDLKGLALTMLALGGLILLIALAAEKIISAGQSLGDPSKIGEVLKPLTDIMWHVAGALALIVLVGRGDASGLKKSGLTFIALAAAIKILYAVAKEIGLLTNDERTALNSGIEYLKRFMLIVTIMGVLIGASGQYLKGAGVSLLLVVAAIGLLFLIAQKIGDLSAIELSKLQNGVSIAAMLGGILAAIVLVATFNEGNMIKAAAGMLIAVVAIGALGAVAYALGSLDVKKIDGGIEIVARLALMLTVMGALFGSNVVNGSDVIKTSAGLVILDVAIGLLAAIVLFLGAIPEDALTNGMTAVSRLSLIIALLTALFSSEVVDGGKVAGVSGSLLVMDLAIGALAAITIFLAGIPDDALVKGELALAGLAVILGGLAALFSAKFINAGKIATTSVALLAMAAALTAMIMVLGLMSDLAKSSDITQIAEIGIILLGFSAGIALVASTLSPVIGTILAIAGAVAILGAAAIEFALAAQIFVNTLVTIAQSASVLEQDLARGIKAICNAIVEASPEITAAVGAILADIFLAIGEFFKNLWNKLGELFPGLTEFFGKIGEFFTNAWEKFKGFFERLWEFTKGIYETIFVKAKEFIANIWNGIKEKWEEIKQKVKELFENPLKFFTETIPNAFAKAKEFISNFWDGLKEKWESLKQKVKELFENPLSFFTETIPNALAKGKEFVSNIWDGITEKWEAVKTWFKNLFKGFIDIISGIFTGEGDEGGGAYSLGVNLIEGIGEGIKKAWEWVKEKVRGIANAVLKFFGIEWEIKSPSRAMMRMGEYLMEGAAIGMEDGEHYATDAATHAADSVTNAMASAINNIDDMLSNEYEPTITPVMDLTQIQNGAYAMGNLLDSYDNYSMQAAIAANYNPYVYPNGTLKVDTRSQMADSIASLENKFDEMLYKLGQIRVVLDSGTLVGELVDPMDEALGRKAVYVGRGM